MVIGSMAVEKREQVKAWIEQFGAEHFVIALDVNKTANGWAPATHGWLSESEFGPSVTAIPKTKPKTKPAGEGGLEPEPSA